MVNKRLALLVVFGNSEDLGKHLFNQLEVFFLVEGLIERKDVTGTLQTVSTVEDKEKNGRGRVRKGRR